MTHAQTLFEFCTLLTYLSPARKAEVMADNAALYRLAERVMEENAFDGVAYGVGDDAAQDSPKRLSYWKPIFELNQSFDGLIQLSVSNPNETSVEPWIGQWADRPLNTNWKWWRVEY